MILFVAKLYCLVTIICTAQIISRIIRNLSQFLHYVLWIIFFAIAVFLKERHELEK